jgi:hypothetical protein
MKAKKATHYYSIKYLAIPGLEAALPMDAMQFLVFQRSGFIRKSGKDPNTYWLKNQYEASLNEKSGQLVITRKSAAPVTAGNIKLNCQTVWRGRFRNEEFIKANARKEIDHCQHWPDGLYGIDPATLSKAF